MAHCFIARCMGQILTGCTLSCMGRCLSHPAENVYYIWIILLVPWVALVAVWVIELEIHIYESYCCVQILTIPAEDFIGRTATSHNLFYFQNANLFKAWFLRCGVNWRIARRRPWCDTLSECISTACWITVYSALSQETAIIWKQPNATPTCYYITRLRLVP